MSQLTRLVDRACAQFRVRRDPIAFHRAAGVVIGDRVELIAATVHMFGSEPYLVSIGDDVTISGDVVFVTHDGGLRVVRVQRPGAFFYAPIIVHDRAFIGTGALILPGVTIGEGSVVGARAVVSRDVPAHTVVAGVPARPIKSVADYVAAREADWIDTSGLDAEAKRRAIESALVTR